MSEINLPKDIKRLHYFTSQFLVAQDFIDEQSYHIEMRRLHNRQLHSWGIVEGLDVTKAQDDDKSVVVSPGVAIDNKGREIVVAAETKVDLSDWGFDLNPPTRQVAFVYAAYKEEECDPYPGNGLNYNTRWREKADIRASVEYPADEPGSKIVLASVGPARQLDTNQRRYSGLNPSTEITARKLTVTGDTTLRGGLTVEVPARFKEGLKVEGAATLAGNTVDIRRAALTPTRQHPTGLALYVSDEKKSGDGGIVEFRDQFGLEGIGFSWTQIYAVGGNQSLVLKANPPDGKIYIRPAGRAPALVVPGGHEALRILRGYVSANSGDGSSWSGAGFTVKKDAERLYTITFDEEFTLVPFASVTQPSSSGNPSDNAMIVDLSKNTMTVKASDRQSGIFDFGFIAIGLC